MSVKRYDIEFVRADSDKSEMVESELGDYVLAADYDALEDELALVIARAKRAEAALLELAMLSWHYDQEDPRCELASEDLAMTPWSRREHAAYDEARAIVGQWGSPFDDESEDSTP